MGAAEDAGLALIVFSAAAPSPLLLSQKVIMSNRRAIFAGLITAVMLGVAMVAYSAISAYNKLPEAYAAWDTGTLLVAYMQENENSWPTNWDDLISVRNSARPSPMIFSGGYTPRGEFGGNDEVKLQLSQYVSVDWNHEPFSNDLKNPVTRLDGTNFNVTWVGGDPNEMVRSYVRYAQRNSAEVR